MSDALAAKLEAARRASAAEEHEQARLRELVRQSERDAVRERAAEIRAAASGGDQHRRDAVHDMRGDGLPSQNAEHLSGTQSEPRAGRVKPRELERVEDVRPKEDRNRHSVSVTRDSGSATASLDELEGTRLESTLAQWWTWLDAEHAALRINNGEPYSFDALASCESVDARDRNFVERLIEATLDDPFEELMHRRGEEAAARWQAHRAQRPRLTPAELADLRQYIHRRFPNQRGEGYDVGSRTQILMDRSTVFPGGDDPTHFTEVYRARIPAGWESSSLLALRTGEHPVIVRWTAKRVEFEATSRWAQHADQYEGAPRFEALEAYEFGSAHRIPLGNVAPAAPTIAALAARPAAPERTRVHPTGIGPLDAALATGGIPHGGRVVLQGTTAQAKTLLALEAAEAMALSGLTVVWYASPDEPVESVLARRRQRMGVSRVEALATSDESMLEPRLVVVDGRRFTIEDVLECRGIDVLVLDPLTKTRTRHGASDPVVRVGHVLDLVEQSGLTALMTVPVVRGAGRRTAIERALGGSRIEAGASLLCELHREGTALTITLLKSRVGGEGTDVHVKLDPERQRVLPDDSGAASMPVAQRIWRDVQRVLAERGPRSARAMTGSVTGKSVTVRSVIREKLGTGELVELDGLLSLP